MYAFSYFLYNFFIKSFKVIRATARYQSHVRYYFFIFPLSTGIYKIGFY